MVGPMGCLRTYQGEVSKLVNLHLTMSFLWQLLAFAVVYLLSRVRLFATPWTGACQASLSITNSRSLLKCMSSQSVMPSNHVILCYLLPLLPSFFPSIRVFFRESALPIRWPKYWSFSFSSSNEYSGLISFRINWLDLSAFQMVLPETFRRQNGEGDVKMVFSTLRGLMVCVVGGGGGQEGGLTTFPIFTSTL